MSTFSPVPLSPPTAQAVIVTCLDHRVDPAIVLGLGLGEAPVIRNAGGRVTQAVIEDIAFLAYLADQLFTGQIAADALFEVAVIHHTQCGTGFLADPAFRRLAAMATGVPEAALAASAVVDPHVTVPRRRRAPARLAAAVAEGERFRSRVRHRQRAGNHRFRRAVPAGRRIVRAVDAVYDPPAYLWAITITGPAAVVALTCVALYGGAARAGLGRGRRRSSPGPRPSCLAAGSPPARLSPATAGTARCRGSPSRRPGSWARCWRSAGVPAMARVLRAPGMASRLVYPHSFRVAGVVFLAYLALGHLPALFALPAGVGDITSGIAAPLVARRLARGTGRRAAAWFNAFGLTDLAVALTLGALTGFGLIAIAPSSAPITELPLALIPTATVPLLLALHITSVSTLSRVPRPVSLASRPQPPSADRGRGRLIDGCGPGGEEPERVV